MANIFAPGGEELAKQKDLDILSGKQVMPNYLDANLATTSGFHYIRAHDKVDGGSNYPTGSWGNMIVSNGENHRIAQLFIPDNGSNPWFRIATDGNWNNWSQLASQDQIDALQSQIDDLKKQIGGTK